jgi:hypothetical protein
MVILILSSDFYVQVDFWFLTFYILHFLEGPKEGPKEVKRTEEKLII